MKVIPFEDIRDPVTGRTRVRMVDVRSEHYQVARGYMTRLSREDLEDPQMLSQLAESAKLTPDAFRTKFAKAAGNRFAQSS